MKRNMNQTAEKAKGIIPERYDLSAGELNELFILANKDPNGTYDAICTAFLYGFMMGHRATADGKLTGRK